jgi:hypothetical protein
MASNLDIAGRSGLDPEALRQLAQQFISGRNNTVIGLGQTADRQRAGRGERPIASPRITPLSAPQPQAPFTPINGEGDEAQRKKKRKEFEGILDLANAISGMSSFLPASSSEQASRLLGQGLAKLLGLGAGEASPTSGREGMGLGPRSSRQFSQFPRLTQGSQ